MKVSCQEAPRVASKRLRQYAQAIVAQVEAVTRADADGIHDMRVASRRLRAVLGEFRPILSPAAYKRLDKRARAITRDLGTARELDVCLGLLDGAAGPLRGVSRAAREHAARALRDRRAAVRHEVLSAAKSAGAAAFRAEVDSAIEGIAPLSACYLEVASKTLLHHGKRLLKHFRRWTRSCEEADLHKLRIGIKKMRYTCEAHRGLYGAGMPRYIRALEGVQDTLGAWNDLRTLYGYVAADRGNADKRAQAGLARLLERIDAEKERLLKRFLREAEAFFGEAHERKVSTLFRTPHTTCCMLKKRREG